MLQLTLILELSLFAASGLVSREGALYVVADDELDLVRIEAAKETHRFPLLPGTLPEDPKERKKVKPDFEALGLIDDLILAFPSGSKKNRTQAVLFDPKSETSKLIDAAPLLHHLDQEIADLNVEGLTVVRDELWLFQRANGKAHQSVIIKLDLAIVRHELKSGKLTTLGLKTMLPVDLGKLDGVPLGFTDAALGPDGVYYLAAAEDEASTYEDGQFTGAVLGMLSFEGLPLRQWGLKVDYKPEGLWFNHQEFMIVTDADSRKTKSQLLRGKLP